jgi:hypothetical protein
MHLSNHMHHFHRAAVNLPTDPIAAEAHSAYRRYRTGRAAATNSIQRYGTGLTAKIIMLSAFEHGQNAARHGKHLQACPFDTGTMEWRQWRDGFLAGTT